MNEQPTAKPVVFNLNFQVPWGILRPPVYRFMDKQYVEQFFVDGSLRLSSFRRFSQHSDEERQDCAEGTAISTLPTFRLTGPSPG